MAVEGPQSRIVSVERHLHCLVGWHEDWCADRSRDRCAVDIEDLEHVPVQVHGMRHHRCVAESKFHPFAVVCGRWQSSHAIDGHPPYVAHHVAGEIDRNDAARPFWFEWFARPELHFLVKSDPWAWLIRPCADPGKGCSTV